MTLIAAFRCYEGVVLCADQQETVGGIRVAVNKIKPQDCCNYQLAFAGSGNGDLIDGFADALRLDVAQWPSQLDENTIRGNIRNLLLDFHENEIALYPADIRSDNLNHCLVCIKPKGSPDIFLWELRGSVIVPVNDYALLGHDVAIYKHEIKKLYRRKPHGLRAVLIGIHLFSLAKETSNYVGGPTDVIFVRDSGMWPEQEQRIRKLTEHMETFNRMTAELLLECADTVTVDEAFANRLNRFQEKVTELREEYIRDAVRAAHVAGTYGGDLKPPYYDYPACIPTRLLPDSSSESQPLDSQQSEGQQ